MPQWMLPPEHLLWDSLAPLGKLPCSPGTKLLHLEALPLQAEQHVKQTKRALALHRAALEKAQVS